MSFSPSSRSEEFNSSPPLVGAFLPLASPDQDPPRDEASHGRTAPPSRHSANDNIMDTIDTKDAKAKTNSELPSSQSGLPVPVSSYAHTKGPMGPPEMRAALPSELNSQSAAVPQFEFDSQPNDHDQLHASRPSTPEEQPELEAEPDKPIEAFDWHDLEMRYHDMIRERDAAEQQLLQEFDHLSQVSLLFRGIKFAIDTNSSSVNGLKLEHFVRQIGLINGKISYSPMHSQEVSNYS